MAKSNTDIKLSLQGTYPIDPNKKITSASAKRMIRLLKEAREIREKYEQTFRSTPR